MLFILCLFFFYFFAAIGSLGWTDGPRADVSMRCLVSTKDCSVRRCVELLAALAVLLDRLLLRLFPGKRKEEEGRSVSWSFSIFLGRCVLPIRFANQIRGDAPAILFYIRENSPRF